MALVLMVVIVVLFAFINFRGASETGLIGNVVTIAKVVILAIFIGFGFRAMIGATGPERLHGQLPAKRDRRRLRRHGPDLHRL